MAFCITADSRGRLCKQHQIGGRHRWARANYLCQSERGKHKKPRLPEAQTQPSVPFAARRRGSGSQLFPQVASEEGAKLVRAGRMPKLVKRLGFDLADALAGDGERPANFLERVLAAVFQPETHLEDLFFAVTERLQHRRRVFL